MIFEKEKKEKEEDILFFHEKNKRGKFNFLALFLEF